MDKKCFKCNGEPKVVITFLENGNNYYVCEEHMDISLNKIAENDIEKQAKIKAHIEELRKMGINVDINTSGLSIASNPIQKPEPKSIKTIEKSLKLDKVRSVKHDVDGTIVGGDSLDIDDEVKNVAGNVEEKTGNAVKLPKIMDIEYQEVDGVAGTKMRVPKKIKHDDGESTINIVKTNHKRIMSKFEADNVEGNERSFKQGYTVRDCPSCGGNGKAKIGRGPCPKCNGGGVIY